MIHGVTLSGEGYECNETPSVISFLKLKHLNLLIRARIRANTVNLHWRQAYLVTFCICATWSPGEKGAAWFSEAEKQREETKDVRTLLMLRPVAQLGPPATSLLHTDANQNKTRRSCVKFVALQNSVLTCGPIGYPGWDWPSWLCSEGLLLASDWTEPSRPPGRATGGRRKQKQRAHLRSTQTTPAQKHTTKTTEKCRTAQRGAGGKEGGICI